MTNTPEPQNTARTWQGMVDSNQALLQRKTGHDVRFWAERARAAGMENDAQLRDWMREEHGITGMRSTPCPGSCSATRTSCCGTPMS